MRCSLLALAMAAGAFAAATAPALAQDLDQVSYLDRKAQKQAEARGVIAEETPARVVIKEA